MALGGVFSFVNLKNFKLTTLLHSDIFALKQATLKIKAKNKYFFGAFLVRIKIFNSETIVPYLKNAELFNINITFPKRGRYILNELTLSSYFPFYFFRRTKKIPLNFEITVFPYPLKCDLSFLISNAQKNSDLSLSKGKSYEGELTGVRSYTQGDPLKYIHWKATAKTSSVKTKEFSPPAGLPVIVNIDDFSGTLEEKISKATYALIKLSKIGNPVGLKLRKEVYKPDIGQSHLRRMLHAVAVYNTQ